MRLDNPLQMIRTLKGAPLSIYLLMQIVGQPVEQGWLITMSGYTDKPVSTALKYLKELNMICQLDRYRWQITTTQQLPLTQSLEPSRIYSDSVEISPAVTGPPTPAQTIPNRTIHNLLKRAGIMDPTASTLIAMEHITEDYVTAHIAKAQDEGITTNLLIHRLRSKDPQPTISTDRHQYIDNDYHSIINC